MKLLAPLLLCCLLTGCSGKREPASVEKSSPLPVYFHADPSSAGVITGMVRFQGKRPAPKLIDMSEEPACVAAHQGKAYDESLLVSKSGALGNAFVYVKSGLEGKTFAVPDAPVKIDQHGCWFRPRVIGLQTGQFLQVINSDPVTHNIHPMAEVNRAWNHSQGAGDPPIARKFTRPEIMIPVKCNIHSWMHALIGVLDHPYFAVSDDSGNFAINNLPPGTYTIAVWQEKLGTQEQQVTVVPRGTAKANFTLRNATLKDK